MKELLQRRRPAFVVVAILIAVIAIAVFRLPESLITQLQNESPFTLTQRGWAFRFLALFALIQALYVGFGVLRSERVEQTRRQDPKAAQLSHERLMASVGRMSAGSLLLTIVYGVAALGFTGFRAGFWLFVFIAAAQGAWYYRQTGQIAHWLTFQPDVAEQDTSGWRREPPDYCPPLTRGLSPIEASVPDR